MKENNRGFSLIELIIVIAIMAVLVAVIAPNLVSYLATSKKRSDEYNANEIRKTVDLVVTDALTNPDRQQVLDNIKNNYNGKIILVSEFIEDVDITGAFKDEVCEKLKSNTFKCKRQGYNFYMQVTVTGDSNYEVVCKSVEATQSQITNWP